MRLGGATRVQPSFPLSSGRAPPQSTPILDTFPDLGCLRIMKAKTQEALLSHG